MQRLHNLKVTRIDLVDRGANFDTRTGEGAHVMIFKRAAGDDGIPLEPEMVAKDAGKYREYRRRYFKRVNS
jgi:hypothetical protein